MMGEIQAYASMEIMDALANGMTCLDVSLACPLEDIKSRTGASVREAGGGGGGFLGNLQSRLNHTLELLHDDALTRSGTTSFETVHALHRCRYEA